MTKLKSMINWAIAQFVLAAIAYFTYEYVLEEKFKLDLDYIHWVAIMLISICIFPSQIPQFKEKKENDRKGSKISRNIPSDGF